jgi:hypothetical protein
MVGRDRVGSINKKLGKLHSRKARKLFLTNFSYPSDQKQREASKIAKYLQDIEEVLPQMEVLLRTYRKSIPNIWDQTKDAASYLLLCKAFNHLQSIIVLAKQGSCSEMVELCRSSCEALDLVFLFLEDGEGSHLSKWFKGEIISNKTARKKIHEILNSEKSKSIKTQTLPVEDFKGDIYETYSLYTHSSYTAIIDSIDPYYEDFDYKKYAGFHYTFSYLHLVDNVAVNILFNLKSVFIKLCDQVNVSKVDELLRDIGYSNMPQESLDEVIRQYTTTCDKPTNK